MRCKTTVKVVFADAPSEPLAGVKVQLFDRDTVTDDDLLGSETTDDVGEACFNYDSEDFLDIDDRVGGEAPDLYAVVYDANDQVVVSTRPDAVTDRHLKHLTVRVDRDLVRQHNLAAGV